MRATSTDAGLMLIVGRIGRPDVLCHGPNQVVKAYLLPHFSMFPDRMCCAAGHD